jgi:uncharacterized protein YndB with AHSA1/START domain
VRTHLDVSRDIAAAPAAAWQALTDTRRWPTWGPTIAEVRSDDVIIEAGSTGRVRPRLGPWVPFRITHLDPGTRWTWRVAGIPATGHRVEPTAAGCRVVFEVPLPAAGYALVCHLALRRLARMLEHGPSSTAS